jgi:hypothetical protein
MAHTVVRAISGFGAVLGVVLALTTGAGCASDGERATARPYPSGQRVRTLDIQAERLDTRLVMTNTSARAFGPSTVWVNASYAREIEAFPIGASLDLDLAEFVDEFGNHFRAGGLFATRRPDDVVLVEIEDAAGDIYGLIVVRDESQ